MSYVVRKPHVDRAGNHRRKGEPMAFDQEAYDKGQIATPQEIAAEAEVQKLKAQAVTYEPHPYERFTLEPKMKRFAAPEAKRS